MLRSRVRCAFVVKTVKSAQHLSKNDTLHFSLPAHCVIVKDIIMTDWDGI